MGIQNSLPKIGNANVGLRTEYATLLPPGSKVAAYVGAIQDDSLDAYSASTLLVGTLAAGIAKCRPGKGDVVIVLPGHTENITSATYLSGLVAGSQIIGVAPFLSGLMPTFTFTNTAAQFNLSAANVTMTGLKFAVGVDAVVNYVTVSGASNYIGGNYFQMGTASATDMQTAMVIATGATNLVLEGNRFESTGTSVNVAAITASGTGLDGLTMNGNYFYANCPTTGVVNFTGTGVNVNVSNNFLYNADATPFGFRVTDTAWIMNFVGNMISFKNAATVTTDAIKVVATTTSNVRLFQNFGNDANTVTAIVCGTGTAT